jgi:hypothetical protein
MTLAEAALVLAMLAQMGWTFWVMSRAARARFAAVREKRFSGDVRLSQEGWPPDVRQLSNNMNNQFETPTLFYALGLLALVLDAASLVMALLAWGYVATRLAHSFVHTTTNYIPHRFRIFVAGYFCLAGMTVLLLIHTLISVAATAGP